MMKKVATLFTAVVLASSLGATGCRRSNKDETVDKSPKPTDSLTAPGPGSGSGSASGSAAGSASGSAAGSATAAGSDAGSATGSAAGSATGSAAGSAAEPAKTGDLPKECADYKAALDKLAACDKVPANAKDALKKSFDQASATWATVPAESKATLSTACTAGAKAVTDATTAAGCK